MLASTFCGWGAGWPCASTISAGVSAAAIWEPAAIVAQPNNPATLAKRSNMWNILCGPPGHADRQWQFHGSQSAGSGALRRDLEHIERLARRPEEKSALGGANTQNWAQL